MKNTTLWQIALLFAFMANPVKGQTVVINEIITSNDNVNVDEDDSYQDWVELYNTGDVPVNLEGYGLTDDASEPFKWTFPAVALSAGQHLLIYCSDKNRTDIAAPLHTNFKISSSGETIVLTDNSSNTVDSYAAIVMPQNYSYGRETDGAENFVFFPEPTPGEPNTTPGYSEILEAPVFSIASSFSEDPFYVDISTTDPTATIIYTTDGSEPDPENLLGTTYQYKNQYPRNPGDPFGPLLEQSFITKTYTSPIYIEDRSSQANKISSISTTYDSDPEYIPDSPVLKSTVVRAKTIKAGAMSSATVTRNYFVNPQGADRFSLPVVAVNLDENLLFDYSDGIHVAGVDFDEWRTDNPDGIAGFSDANYNRDDAEVKGNFSYYTDTEEVINQDVGIRIHGGFTKTFPNKSLRLYARSEFGSDTFDFPFFSDSDDSDYKTLILRNSGNDQSTTYFLDAFVQQSVKHLHFDTQAYQQAISFINGEYWGMLNLRERYDKHYFKRVYGIDEDEVDHIEQGGGLEVKEGDLDHYTALIDYIENNPLSDEEHYSYVTTQLDPENFADYFISEIYIANIDWPGNNMEFFRKRTAYDPGAAYGNDGRWRWMMKDTDVSFGLATSYTHNTLAFATDSTQTQHPNPAWATFLLRKMLESDTFRHHFISRFADLMNTTFLPDRMQGIFDVMKDDIAEEIPAHIDRWIAMESVGNWEAYCAAIINYAYVRPDIQRQHIREKFDIAGNVTTTLDVSDSAHGYIKINTIDINPETAGVSAAPYPWTGTYFEGVPVTLTAIPLPGYAFSHWTGANTSESAEIVINPSGDFSVTAHFIESAEVEETPIVFWMADTSMANDTPFETIASTYEVAAEGILEYESALPGYPYTEEDPLWRTASLERVNDPTEINYLPTANDDIEFDDSDMRGLQVRQPFQNEDRENTLIFHQSTVGYNDIIVRFAAKDDDAADAITVDYSVQAGDPAWITTGLAASSLPLSEDYGLFEIDFSDITTVNNNADFKFRLRFTGENMTEDDGGKVIFNNISISGKALLNVPTVPVASFRVYPNPVSATLFIKSEYEVLSYKLFSLDGRLVRNGNVENSEINVNEIANGIYMLQLASAGKNVLYTKIVKK